MSWVIDRFEGAPYCYFGDESVDQVTIEAFPARAGRRRAHLDSDDACDGVQRWCPRAYVRTKVMRWPPRVHS
jgi:hypothetical protein